MTRRTITLREIKQFHALAASGMCRAHAARALGRSDDWAAYWAARWGITFQPVRHRAYGVDDFAIARLQRTMERLRAQL